MRTTKRFTKKVLERFIREGRGTGQYESYIPWHRVSRGDPSSRGRSHLQMWRGRQCELLSDGEWNAAFFAMMLPNIKDIREQFPLRDDPGRHELADYICAAPTGEFPGTQSIVDKLKIPHPKITCNGEVVDWIPTTDLLLFLSAPGEIGHLSAVAVKPTANITKAMRRSLSIEKAYWDARAVPWLLITPAQYDRRVGLMLRRSMPWALGERVTDEAQSIAADVVQRFAGRSLTFVLEAISDALAADLDHAQRAFWQGVWGGLIPFDLRQGWRPHLPVMLLPLEAFWSLNPIASRRSAWN